MMQQPENPSFRGMALQAVAWVGIYLFWLYTLRAYHPTWRVAVWATLILVASYAVAVTGNLYPLARVRARRGLGVYLASLLGMEVALTLVVVPSIQIVYDLFCHPDPRRFGFWTNFWTDFLGMNLHVLAGLGIASRFKRRTSFPAPTAR